MATVKQSNREKLIGYILITVLVIGLIFLVYWTVTMNETGSRFQNIEKLRGEITPPASSQAFDNEMLSMSIFHHHSQERRL